MSHAQKLKTSRRMITSVGVLLFALLFVGGGLWLTFAEISGAVVAQGTIVVQGHSKVVQHLEGGVVTDIAVIDGDDVKAGDIVMQLDDKLLRANLNVTINRLQEAVAVKARLIAERDEQETIQFSSKALDEAGLTQDENVIISQRKLFEARRTTRLGQRDQILEQIEQFKNQVVGIEAQEASLRSQITLLDDQMKGQEELLSQGFSSESVMRDLKRQHAELGGELGQIIASKAQVENSINEAEIEILQGSRQFTQEVLAELTSTSLEIRELTQQLYATTSQLERTQIKAPISGMVHQMSVYTIGGVVANGAPLMEIVPQDQDIEIEITVEPQDVDNLYTGQPSGVRLSAFNQRTTPELEGFVSTIAPNTITNEETGASFYLARVKLRDTELEKLGDRKLVPGMPVEVFVKTSERTALNYLIKPLLDQVSRAFREE